MNRTIAGPMPLVVLLGILSFFAAFANAYAQKILIPMDMMQTDHLKAYGVAYWTLERQINVEWLLNYRGGAFLADYNPEIERECRVRGVALEIVDAAGAAGIYNEIENNNMEV